MANPSPQAVAAIRAHVPEIGGWGQGNDSLVQKLNATDQANPTTRLTVAKPLDTASLLGKLSKVAKGKVYGRPAIIGLQADIRSGNRVAVKNWFGLAYEADDISGAEYASLIAEVDATIPDPAWPATISWAQATLGRPVDLDDVATARQGA